MAFINLPFGIKVEMIYSLNGELCVNIFWCTKNTANPITAADLTNVIAAFYNAWNVPWKTVFQVNQLLTQIRATDWSVPGGIQSTFVVPGANQPGTAGGDLAPNNVAVVASLRTGFSGRSRRGRTYWGGVSESQLTAPDNLVVPGMASVVATGYQNVRTALTAVGFTQVVASFYTNGAPRANGLGTPLTAIVIDQPTDSQRRRLHGRGA